MKQKGGSVASDAVTSLVSADTYTKMNAGFTNSFANGQCGGSQRCPTCGGSGRRKSKKTMVKKGGNATPSLGDFLKSLSNSTATAMASKSQFTNSSPYVSSPAPALNSTLLRNVAINSTVKSHFANSATNSVKLPSLNSATLQKTTQHNVSKFMNAAPKPVTLPTPASITTNTPVIPKVGGKKKKISSKKKSPKKVVA